jgi:hypothetical protein
MLRTLLVRVANGCWASPVVKNPLTVMNGSPDAAAYFFGQGFANARALAGGIDAWSERIDPDLPRYSLE